MYNELNDNEIIYMVRENEDNVEILMEKYKPLVAKICNKYLKIGKSVGMEFDDLMQIGNIAIIDAIKYYKENQKTLFFTYVSKCVENNIKSELRKEMTYRKSVLNSAISLYDKIPGTDKTLFDAIKDEEACEPIEYLITEEKEIAYVQFLNSLPLEVAITFEMKLGGFTNTEISKFLHLDKNTVSKYASYAKNRLCLN